MPPASVKKTRYDISSSVITQLLPSRSSWKLQRTADMERSLGKVWNVKVLRVDLCCVYTMGADWISSIETLRASHGHIAVCVHLVKMFRVTVLFDESAPHVFEPEQTKPSPSPTIEALAAKQLPLHKSPTYSRKVLYPSNASLGVSSSRTNLPCSNQAWSANTNNLRSLQCRQLTSFS